MTNFEDDEAFVLRDWGMMHPVERVDRTHRHLIPKAVRGLLDALDGETKQRLWHQGQIELLEDQAQRLTNGHLSLSEARVELLDRFEPFALLWAHQAISMAA